MIIQAVRFSQCAADWLASHISTSSDDHFMLGGLPFHGRYWMQSSHVCILCTHWDYGTMAEAMRVEDHEGEAPSLCWLLLYIYSQASKSTQN